MASHKELIKTIRSRNDLGLAKILEDDQIKTLLNTRDNKGRQALHIACKLKRAKILVKMIQCGADIHSKCFKGYTPLHYACLYPSLPCIVILLEMGADLRSSQDNNGRIPLELIPEKKQNNLGALLRRAETNYNVKLGKVKETPNDIFLNQFVLNDCIKLLCLDDIEVHKNNELAKGPRTNYCHGNFHYLNVMVKYENEEASRTLRDELLGIRAIGNHINVLELLGVTCSVDNVLQLIYPHPQYGFLHRAIFHNNLQLNTKEVLSIGKDISNALRYIHDQGYLHCAVATFSIIVDNSFEAKICNLNYLQEINYPSSISHYPSLFPYMSYKQRKGHPSDETNDVYGMGVVLYECVTRRKMQDFEKELDTKLNPRESYLLKMKQIPNSFHSDINLLIGVCMDPNPPNRHSADQIFRWLEEKSKGKEVSLFDNDLTSIPIKSLQLS